MKKILFVIFITISQLLKSQCSVDAYIQSGDCGNLCQGEASAFGTGTTPLNYYWSNGDNGTIVDSLCADSTYYLTMIDNSGCTVYDTLIFPPAIVTVSHIVDNTSCPSCCDGTDTLTGIPTFAPPCNNNVTYRWIPLDTFADTIPYRINLCAQSYTVVISNLCDGCVYTSSVTIGYNMSTPLTVSESHLNPSCFGYCNGVINIIPSGGTPPYSGAGTFTGICAGTYTINVTDGVGSTASITVTIVEPPLLVANAVSTNVTCYGLCNGTASITASGGTPAYSYSLCGGAFTSTSSITGICPGSCIFTVTDSKGCQAMDTVIITQPAPINCSFIVTNVSCNGDADGSICTTVSGGVAPYVYSWTPGGVTSPCFTSATAYTYTLCVTDSYGCTVCNTAIVTEPSPIQVFETIGDASCSTCCDGNAELTASGGSAPYSFLWSTGDFNDSIGSLCTGVYNYCVTDANGCTSCDSIVVSFPLSSISLESDYTYAVFPNPNNGNFEIVNSSPTISDVEIKITDVNGKLILQKTAKSINQKVELNTSIQNGVYFVYLHDLTSEQIIVKKLVIQE